MNRIEHLAALRLRANTTDLLMRRSLQAWIEACTPAVDGEVNRHRVPLSRVLDHFQHRLMPVSYEPQSGFERNGFTIRDTPFAAVDICQSVILPGGAVLCEDKLFAEDFRSCPVAWENIGWYMAAQDIGFADYNIETKTALVDLPPEAEITALPDTQGYFLFMSNYSGGNFGHFIHDTLGQLAAYEQASERCGERLTPILSKRFQFPMQTFLFEKLVGPLSDAVYLPAHPISVNRCYGATRPIRNPATGEVSIHAFRHLRKRIQEMKRTEKLGGGLSIPRLYISRSDATGPARKFANVPAAEALLREHNFAFVTISRLPPEQLVTIFDDCALIAGVHGAGLLNVILTSGAPRVLEFLDHPKSWETISSVLCTAGFDHLRLAALPPTPQTNKLPSLDLEGLTQVLRQPV